MSSKSETCTLYPMVQKNMKFSLVNPIYRNDLSTTDEKWPSAIR